MRVRRASSPGCYYSNGVQARNMATLKESNYHVPCFSTWRHAPRNTEQHMCFWPTCYSYLVQLRLKAVSNIEKITKSMKMIASTKVNKAQRGMEAARAFGAASNGKLTRDKERKCGSDVWKTRTTALFENAQTSVAEDSKTLFITSSSDRGLCGGIHSSVSKFTRRAVEQKPDAQIVVLGDKAKAQLSRALRKNIAITFNQIGKDVPTFAEACSVVDIIKAEGIEFDKAEIVYNQFKSVIAYEATTIPAYSESVLKASRMSMEAHISIRKD